MRILLLVVAVAYIADPPKTKAAVWWDFWKPPAVKVNQYLKHFYCRARNFSDNWKGHQRKWDEGFKRLVFVFWLGICPERLKTPVPSVTTPTTMLTWPARSRGKKRFHPLLVSKNETDFKPKPWRRKKPTTTTTRCPPKIA